MQMFYGPVPIKVSRLLGHEAEAVYDASNTDYLFTRHIISVEGLVGRNTVMYKMVSDFTAVGPVPMVWNGIGNAIESVAAIRHALSQPRQPLLLFTGPQPDFLNAAANKPAILIYCNGLDANNGPRPLEPVSIQSVHGDGNLAFIRFTVQLEINECPLVSSLSNKPPTPDPFAAYNLRLLSVAGLPVLLSNRYSSSIIYSGEDESVTYRYSGRATFRSDALQRIAGLASVDQFRGSLLPPPVVNCRREIKQLDISADGLNLDYVVDDVETLRVYQDYPADKDGKLLPNSSPRNIESIDVQVTKHYSQPDVGRALLNSVDEMVQAGFAIPEGQDEDIEDKVTGVKKKIKNRAVAAARKAVTALRTLDRYVVPSFFESATATVQINRKGKMDDAKCLAFALVAGALNQGVNRNLAGNGWVDGDRVMQFGHFILLPPAQYYILQYSPTQGVVRVTCSIERSGLAEFLIGSQRYGAASLLAKIPDDLVGGRISISIFSIIDLLGSVSIDTIIGMGIPQIIRLVKARTDVTKYADQQLLTEKDAYRRGLSGDGFSRSAVDLLIRSAANLLHPCGTPLPPMNQKLRTLTEPTRIEAKTPSKETAEPPPPKTSDLSNQFTETTLRSSAALIAEWEKEMKGK